MSDPNILIGQRVDHYQIIQHIARGGMADVYLAEDSNLHRRVAVKVLLELLAIDEQFVQRFQREAQIVAQLEHPNIVQVYGVGKTASGLPYIAMQYIDGGSLRDKLKELAQRGKLLTTEQSLNIARQVAVALGVAHQARIIHRDLKPGNVLVRPDGTPVLVDLGIAVMSGGPKLTQTGGIVGTPQYMSPEQVRGQLLDGRSDLYSLGIILYEMLAGTRPFEAEESIAVMHQQAYEEPPPLRALRPDLSPQTLTIVETCLQKDPDKRFQRAEAVVTAIDQALRAEGNYGPNPRATQVLTSMADSELLSRRAVVRVPTGAPASSPGSSTPPAPRRSFPVPIWAIVTLITLAAASVLFAVLQSSGKDEETAPTTAAMVMDTPVLSEVATAVPTQEAIVVVTQVVVVATVTDSPTTEPEPTPTSIPPTAEEFPTAVPTPALADRYTGRDSVEMRLVPEGSFLMGSTSAEVDQAAALCRRNPDGDSCARSEFASEMPQHSVFLSAFYMDVTEITNGQYKACVNAGDCNPPASGSGAYSRSSYYDQTQYANYPVVNITWFDARDYCIWAGERLPTEAEWEKAARSDDGRIFPWGNSFDENRANTEDRGTNAIQPVGQYSNGASPYGMLDMAGNVWEYVADWFDPNYYANSPGQDPTGPTSSPTGQRVLRSGSYANFQHYARVANRGAVEPGTNTPFRGFRCALEATAVTP
ncbi:MAG: SUMF1/EgtB/PvdO family nonheme iron enzyme [Ardenticatenaceae bacterium]|nr:SUMF1/EgtB/PvdO family nonheme iron enzyme [Ardenticatenaceae bacterium]